MVTIVSPRLALLLAPFLAIGVVSFAIVRSQHAEGSAVIAHQQEAQRLTGATVAAVVKAAPDPFSGKQAVQTICVPLGAGALRNPWRCMLRYADRREVQFRVVVSADGHYVGNDQVVLEPGPPRPAAGSVTGCCVNVP
jgi:hypothetical protein